MEKQRDIQRETQENTGTLKKIEGIEGNRGRGKNRGKNIGKWRGKLREIEENRGKSRGKSE